MRNLAGSTSPNGRGLVAPFATPQAEPLQASYCLVSEEDMNASVERRPRSQTYTIPTRRKLSPAKSSEEMRGRSQNDNEKLPSEPRSPTQAEGGTFRRESTQTVKPGDPGLTTRPSNTRSSSVLSPSVPEGSVAISDISCSIPHRDSPVASFSEYPFSHAPSGLGEMDTSSLVHQDQPIEYSEQRLIMPLITLPDRRPFTETGKAIGGLKILVTGAKGTGKTSLIRAILQCCEHIVHVGQTKDVLIGRNLPNYPRLRRGESDFRLTEVYASTMPRPPWWTPCEDEASEPCQDYETDTQFDKNICFVDTPGHGVDSNLSDCISLVRDYIESHLTPHLSSAAADADMLKLLSASGGSLVSSVLYLISPKGITKEDMQFLSALQQVTNVIPVVSHADILSVEEVASIKETVAQQLAENYVRPFTFSNAGAPEGTVDVYAISSSPGSEFDLTDASLLVNSEYIQPLVTTDLARLVDDIFCPNGASWLRHSAAKVYLQWRKRHTQYGYGMDLCLAPRLSVQDIAPAGGILRWRRDVDSSRTDDELLDDWAAALRRSLSNNGVQNTNLLQLTHPANMTVARRRHSRSSRRLRLTEPKLHQDPLGLLQILGTIKNRGQTVVEVVGTVGVLGTFGVWMWYAGGPGA